VQKRTEEKKLLHKISIGIAVGRQMALFSIPIENNAICCANAMPVCLAFFTSILFWFFHDAFFPSY